MPTGYTPLYWLAQLRFIRGRTPHTWAIRRVSHNNARGRKNAHTRDNRLFSDVGMEVTGGVVLGIAT